MSTLGGPTGSGAGPSILDVRIFSIDSRRGTRGTTYRVRWKVGTVDFSRSFKTRALADAFRTELKAATRRGEGFDAVSGLPVSSAPDPTTTVSCYQHACDYVDAKWKFAAGKSRVGTAETLAIAMAALLPESNSRPSAAELRRALYSWAFNPPRRRGAVPDEIAKILAWVERHSPPVDALRTPTLLRKVVDALSCKLDGTPAAASTFRRKRAVFNNHLEFAVELGRLPSNPLTRMKRTIPKAPEAVDPRVLVDRKRAEALLSAVGEQGATGRRLVAFFGCMYYAALRPSEVVDLREANLALPDPDADAEEWGELHLSGSAPVAGMSWTDSGRRRDSRQLKHRARGDVRVVPCHPRLVQLLREHLAEHGTAPGGRLFRGTRGGPIAESVYGRVWGLARTEALTPDEAAGSMAARPYDLRHACVTSWLNATGDPAQVAAWAGHSPNVLLRVYVRCVAGRDEVAKRRVAEALEAESD